MSTDSRCCWQYRALSMSRSYYSETIQISLLDFAHPSAPRRETNIYLWSVRKRKTRPSKCGFFFYILLWETTVTFLQSDWLIFKRHSITITLLPKAWQKPENQFVHPTECMLHTAKPCSPRTRRPQLYGEILRDLLETLFGCSSPVASQVAQARNMSIGEHRHCCVTFKIKEFVWGKNLSFL